MIFVLIVIVTSASFNIFFKIFERLGVHTLQAILFNYVAAVAIGFYISPITYSLPEMVSKGWFYTAMLLGVSYFISMYLYSLSTIHIGVALTALLTRTSLVIPTVAALLFFNEVFTIQMAIAIVMILVSLYFIFYEKSAVVKKNKGWLLLVLLPVSVFVTCGINDTVIKVSQFFFIKNDADNASFVTMVYITALLFGLISYFSKKVNRQARFSLKSALWGVVMGVINIINSLAILKALEGIPASVAFPIINTGIVVISTLVGVWFFKEQLTKRKIIGIAIAVAAIILLS